MNNASEELLCLAMGSGFFSAFCRERCGAEEPVPAACVSRSRKENRDQPTRHEKRNVSKGILHEDVIAFDRHRQAEEPARRTIKEPPALRSVARLCSGAAG